MPDAPSFLGIVFRLAGCLAVITVASGYFAAYEATPEGSAHTFMAVVGFIVVPVLWLLSEGLTNPLLDLLQSRPWWSTASSALHIALGVLVTLPLFAYMVASFWLFRRWFGVPGW
jgi:hypothetical protein